MSNDISIYEQIIQHMKKLGYKDHWIGYTMEWVGELHETGVRCLNKFERKLLNTRDKTACSDIIIESRIAFILSRNGFEDIYLEPYDKGPDIKAQYKGRTIYFEVTRRHAEVDEWADDFDINTLPPDKIESIIGRIQAKLKQFVSGEINIVVLYSSTAKLVTPDVREAFQFIQTEIENNPGTYKDLSGVLFTEDCAVEIRIGKSIRQFDLLTNTKASVVIDRQLARKLESLLEYPGRDWRQTLGVY